MSLKVINPYDRAVEAELPIDEGAGLDRKVDAALHAFEFWRCVPPVERTEMVRRALDYFRVTGQEVARDITRQMGKPLSEARREVETMLARADHMTAIALDALRPERPSAPPGFEYRVEHEPLGVVLDIAAWNYPMLIAVNVVVPAVLAGNAVLLKHSAKTPLCGLHFERAFDGVQAGLVSNLVLSHAATLSLVGDARVAHVAFTGSVDGGRNVHRAAAERFIDVGLELGGKDPAYVAEDCDLDFTAENVVDGACYNAGQSCCAVERVYVHESLYETFLSKARAAMERYVLGDPMDPRTTMGPLAVTAALAKLERQVEEAVRRGARLLLGGRRLEGSHAPFFAPTLLADVPNEAVVMQEETFGPILAARAVSSDDEAIRLMNDSRYGLTASVWTKSAERAERFVRSLDVGTIYQNRCDYLDPSLPWVGVKDSGKGSTLSRYGFLQLTRRKSVHLRP